MRNSNALLIPIIFSYCCLALITFRSSTPPVVLAITLLLLTFIALLALVCHFIACRLLHDAYFSYTPSVSLSIRNREADRWDDTDYTDNFNNDQTHNQNNNYNNNYNNHQTYIENADLIDSIPTPVEWGIE